MSRAVTPSIAASAEDDAAGIATLLEWQDPVGPKRLSRALVLSILFHVLFFGGFWFTPDRPYQARRRPQVTMDYRKVTPLYLPKSLQLTQREKSTDKAKQRLDIRSALPSAPSVRDFRPPSLPGPVTRDVPTEIASAAPPRIDPQINPDVPQLPGIVPSLPSIAQPKSPLENVTPAPRNTTQPGNSPLNSPRVSVEDAVRAARSGGGGAAGSGGVDSAPAAAQDMQLLSDPMGVDFKPYLLQVLAVVRQHWFAVIPDVARTGRMGQTKVQFVIDRQGTVPKLVISQPSGTPAFDRAAIASISASYPFPPLPNQYPGQEIRLQLAFDYNLPKPR